MRKAARRRKNPVRAILHALSYGGIELEASRRMADLKRLDLVRIFCRKLDADVANGDYQVPIRLYFPNEEAMLEELEKRSGGNVLLFFHGGGWVTESVENYDRICSRLAQSTGDTVMSVEYRLAPEHRFPTGLMDCYAAAQALYTGKFMFSVRPEEVTLIGDSAGGNLAAAVALMARERGEFEVKRQILIYPALGNCYTEDSPYPSVQENGYDYLLTAQKMEDYLKLYESSPEDRKNPWFAPILAEDLSHMPDTLILTAEHDPLRDEGEAYGERLSAAGNRVEVHRIRGALHGYFALGMRFYHVRKSLRLIGEFLKKEAEVCVDDGGEDVQMEKA